MVRDHLDIDRVAAGAVHLRGMALVGSALDLVEPISSVRPRRSRASAIEDRADQQTLALPAIPGSAVRSYSRSAVREGESIFANLVTREHVERGIAAGLPEMSTILARRAKVRDGSSPTQRTSVSGRGVLRDDLIFQG